MGNGENLASLRNNIEAYSKFFVENDKLGLLLGARFISLNREECVYEYTVSPSHFNSNNILHGGALYTVMDSSQGAFVNFIVDAKYEKAVTGTATIRYEAPLRAGTARIRTWLKSQEGRKLFVSSEAHDEKGKLLATLEEIWIAIVSP